MKTWLDGDRLFNQYEASCRCCDIGVRCVNPQRIVGLSRACEEIHNDIQMENLRNVVQTKGWNDPHPEDLDLYRLPDGRLIVQRGGNHRVIYANELGLMEISALVTVMVPIAKIPDHMRNQIERIEAEIGQLRAGRLYHQLPKDARERIHMLSEGIQTLETTIGNDYLTNVEDDLQ